LYSDNEEEIFESSRPVILNGIEDFITRPDLADRTLALHLRSISRRDRMLNSSIQARFEATHPQILGGLLDAVSTALARSDSVVLDEMPRMADFCHWVVAAELALPWQEGTFLEVMARNQEELVGTALEESSVAIAIREFMQERTVWRSTATELFNALNVEFISYARRFRDWPANPAALSRSLSRQATSLRHVGIHFDRTGGAQRQVILQNVGAPEQE
jgi:hypothetical protein